MNNYKYKFSVVIPIYNVENYLEETIESVINQDIGFKDNIQMILVNDGSPDNSEKICLKYKEMYPNNVVYVKQENSGVSATRNNGMKYIQGKYTNFLDSDDKWELDVFSKVWNFFEENYNKINLLSCRMKFFEAKDDYHLLDYKFHRDRVINIFEEYDSIQLHITASFIKSEILTGYKFNTTLKYGEDAEFVTKIILDKSKYAVLGSATNYYRKRINNSSAVQNKEQKIEWYTDTMELFYKSIIKHSKKLYERVIPYVQYIIMYDFQWRIKKEIPKQIPQDIKIEYIKNLKELLGYIEDYIICAQRSIYSEYKIYALCLKYNRDIRNELIYRKGDLYFNNIKVYSLISRSVFKISLLDIKNNMLLIEGQINCILSDSEYDIYFRTHKGKIYRIEYFDIYNNDRHGLDGLIMRNRGFRVKIPLKDVKEITAMILYKEVYRKRLKLQFQKFAKINENIEDSYYSKGKYILRTKNNILYVEKNSKYKHIKAEILYLKSLKKEKEYKLIWYRIFYYILKKIKKKKIWLISDRENKGNDNGEHLFKYIQKQKNKYIKAYFVIDSKSEDYKRLKKIGSVIKANSFKHKLYFLLANKVISSQANEYVINVFKEKREFIKDLYRFHYIFLQHGITKDDLSGWINKYAKNIKMLVTAGKPEYNSIIKGKYNYSEEVVKLTGFPRYDGLYEQNKMKKKQIIVIPTWRRTIKGSYNEITGESIYLDTFKNTEYFKFYNNLINDDRILKSLKQKGYTLKMCLHPSHVKQYIDFDKNEYVEINQGFVDYQKEFKEGDLLITDYSSVFFDFAYLRKPIIYTQFDVNSFFNGGHAYNKGYFEYDKDGFGPVCYDYETAVQTITNYINNDCKIEEKYLERIEKFYAYNDKNNCQRVYEEILKIK